MIPVPVANQTGRRRICRICKAFIYNGVDRLRCLCLHFLPRFLAKQKRGKSGTNGVEVLVEEEVVVEVEVAASNQEPNPVPIQLR